MPNQPFYTCSCLNVKLYISEKDAAKPPESRQLEKLEGLGEGWLCQLGSDGIVTKFANLTSTEKSGHWKTTSCENCSTGKIYSLNQNASLSDSNAVVIHPGTMFINDLDNIKNDKNYSPTFGIKIEQNTAMQYADQSPIPEGLRSERQQLVQMLDQSLDKMQLESQLRLEQLDQEMQRLHKLREEEMDQLKRDITKANAESSVLWHKMVAVEKVKAEADRRRKTIAARETQQQQEKQQQQHVRFAEEHNNAVDSPTDSNKSDDEEEDMFDMDEKESSNQKYISDKLDVDDEDEDEDDDMDAGRSVPTTNSNISMAASVPINILRSTVPSAPKLQLDTLPLGQSLDTRHRTSLSLFGDDAGF